MLFYLFCARANIKSFAPLHFLVSSLSYYNLTMTDSNYILLVYSCVKTTNNNHALKQWYFNIVTGLSVRHLMYLL